MSYVLVILFAHYLTVRVLDKEGKKEEEKGVVHNGGYEQPQLLEKKG